MVILDKRRKLIRVAVIAMALIFVAYQYYVGFYAAIKTEQAEQFQYTEGVDTVGTFIRSEMTVDSNHKGTVHFVVANGEKVAKGGTIAKIYESDSASAAASRINEIDSQLEIIAEIEGYNDSTAVDVDTINDRITSHINEFVYTVQDGRFYDVGKTTSNLLTMMTRKQVATGEQSDFSALKESLKTEREKLAEQMGQEQGKILSDKSGYFVSDTDGYETKLSPSNLENITPEFLKQLKSEAAGEKAIGKRKT